MKYWVNPSLVEEIRGLLNDEPVREDSRTGIRVFGPLSGKLRHLVVVTLSRPLEDTGIESSSIAWPLPSELDCVGFLGVASEFLGDEKTRPPE